MNGNIFVFINEIQNKKKTDFKLSSTTVHAGIFGQFYHIIKTEKILYQITFAMFWQVQELTLLYISLTMTLFLFIIHGPFSFPLFKIMNTLQSSLLEQNY